MKNIRILIPGLLLGMIVFGCVNKQEKANELLNNGIDKIYEGDFREATVLLQEAIEYAPGMAEAYFHLSNAHFNMGNTTEAMSGIDKAIELRPGYADAYFNRGNLWFYLGDRDKACTDWKKAEELGKPNVSEKTRQCP